MAHTKGYIVCVYTEQRWFSSLSRAKEYMIRQEKFCENVQIVNCSTGKLVYSSRGLMEIESTKSD